jgi:hypothetical protein
MSNSRQFLLPTNYDVTKAVYPNNDIVRKRQYLVDELNSTQQYRQSYANAFSGEANFESKVYADKLRRQAKQ